MAQILPANTTLEEVMEGEAVNQTFSASFEADESLVSLTIIDYQPVTGIQVFQTHYTGHYNSVFTTGSDSLKYREGDQFKSAGSWDALPDPKTVDLYLWKAPQGLSKTFTYKLELIYNVTTPGDPELGTGPIVTKKTMTKVYSQTVKGNWSLWADKLRAYVYARD